MIEFYQRFQTIERKFNLFDKKDNRGTVIWETIRYSVYTQISQGRAYLQNLPLPKTNYVTHIKDLIHFVKYFLHNRHKEILVISCSRDKKEGFAYDKILDSAIQSIGMKNCMILDTCSRRNIYKGNCASTIGCSVFEKCICTKYDLGNYIEKIKNAFDEYKLNTDELKRAYKEFYGQYYFYRYLFLHSNIKKVLFVQNGIQKGLMKVANEKGIELIEFQHGQISNAHPAYSYPHEPNLNGIIYAPNKLFTFGQFWNNICHIPGCECISIGNDNFIMHTKSISNNKNKDILVVSSLVHGDVLADYVLSFAKDISDIHFYYKLHPNEYHKVSFYKDKFKETKNVEVITNEINCTLLLQKVAYTLVIQSTVEFEALSQGVKVIVLEKLDYMALSCLFKEEGVYRVKDKNDFLEIYHKHIDDVIKPRNDFFAPYNEKVIKEFVL